MDNIKLQQKLNHLKWLKYSGIEYYSSIKKDSVKSQMELLKKFNLKEKRDDSLQNINHEMPKRDFTDKKTKNVKKSEHEVKGRSKVVQEARVIADSAGSIAQLKNSVENFNGCSLKDFASNTVFSDGVEDAKILLIGEAPGAKEDEKGVPFCGESGQLLDKMMAAIGLSREKNIYITNTVFWRPPANRRPTNEEIEICKPFVEKHIALIKPKLIILVGGTATTSLLGTSEGISHIRQNNHSYINQYLEGPIKTTAIFHPAYLLRQPMKKKDTWYDLLKIQKMIANL